MAKRFAPMLVALLVMGFAVAGCGDDDDEKSSDSGGETTEQTQDTGSGDGEPAEEPAEDPEGDSGGSVDTSDPQIQQAIQACKDQINVNAQLSDEAKSKAGEVCEEAASGDADGAAKATKEVCEIIVEDTAPAGPARDQALKSCDAVTATP